MANELDSIMRGIMEQAGNASAQGGSVGVGSSDLSPRQNLFQMFEQHLPALNLRVNQQFNQMSGRGSQFMAEMTKRLK